MLVELKNIKYPWLNKHVQDLENIIIIIHPIASRWPQDFVGLAFVYICLLAPQVTISQLLTNSPQNLRPTGRNSVYRVAHLLRERFMLTSNSKPQVNLYVLYISFCHVGNALNVIRICQLKK